jgi:hypothetical protein
VPLWTSLGQRGRRRSSLSVRRISRRRRREGRKRRTTTASSSSNSTSTSTTSSTTTTASSSSRHLCNHVLIAEHRHVAHHLDGSHRLPAHVPDLPTDPLPAPSTDPSTRLPPALLLLLLAIVPLPARGRALVAACGQEVVDISATDRVPGLDEHCRNPGQGTTGRCSLLIVGHGMGRESRR